MIEIRIDHQDYCDMPSKQRQQIKNLAQQFADNMGMDHEFMYMWAEFTPENWLLACIHDQDIKKYQQG